MGTALRRRLSRNGSPIAAPCAVRSLFGRTAEVCPITQKPLRLEECQADPEMKKRIVLLNFIKELVAVYLQKRPKDNSWITYLLAE